MSYKVTIKHEERFGHNGPCWVARDESGTWRTFAKEHFAETAAGAVAAMYHANEVEAVDDKGDVAIVTVSD